MWSHSLSCDHAHSGDFLPHVLARVMLVAGCSLGMTPFSVGDFIYLVVMRPDIVTLGSPKTDLSGSHVAHTEVPGVPYTCKASFQVTQSSSSS